MFVIKKLFIFRKHNKKKQKIEKFIFLKDEPIEKENEDLLGRKNFISILAKCLNNIEWKKSATILLSAKWGEGKTSCINLLKNRFNIKFKLLRKSLLEEQFCFIDINPWFNDTKEKLLNAIFGELNNFVLTNYPYKSLENEFNDIIKLSTIKIPKIPIELNLNKFTTDKNIQNKIKEIDNVLKKYSKRIIIVFDDIDRLAKKNILYILQVVQMFKQYTNIIFILSCNYEKVEQILCETSEAYVTDKENNHEIKKVPQYKGYIDKISTIIIPLPRTDIYYIQKILLIEINKFLKPLNKIIKEEDFYRYIALKNFSTLRQVKRFLSSFSTMYLELKNEINIFNFINIVILFVFYPKIYNDSWINKRKWFYIETIKKEYELSSVGAINFNRDKFVESIISFFNNLISDYSLYEQDIIRELISFISPVYNNEYNLQKETPNKEGKSYFNDMNRYLPLYYTYTFSENRIQDNIIEMELLKWSKEKDTNKRYKYIEKFINDYSDKIDDLFNYIYTNYNGYFIELYKTIFYVFSNIKYENKNTFYIIYSYIRDISVKMFEQKEDRLSFYIDLIKEASFFPFIFEIYQFVYFMYKDEKEVIEILDNLNLEIDSRIKKNTKLFLNNICFEHLKNYLYFHLFGFYCHIENRNFDIFKLNNDEYYKLRIKANKIFDEYILKEKKFFDMFIWNDLKENLNKSKNKEFVIENIYDKNILFYLNIWGTNKIEKYINDNYPKDIDLLESVINDEKLLKKREYDEKEILKKLSIMDVSIILNKNFTQDIKKYDDVEYLKDSIYAIYEDEKQISLLDVRIISNKIELKTLNDNFGNAKVQSIVLNLHKKNTKIIQYILFCIFENQKLLKEIDVDRIHVLFRNRPNNPEKIEDSTYKFNIFNITKKELVSKY